MKKFMGENAANKKYPDFDVNVLDSSSTNGLRDSDQISSFVVSG